MYDYTIIRDNIEEEYDAYCRDAAHDLGPLFENLMIYLKHMARSFMRGNGYIDEVEIEDIVNEALADIAEKSLKSFQKGEALFSTYCAQIVKNKIRNWTRKNIRICLEGNEVVEASCEEAGRMEGARREFASPEQQLLVCERQLEIITLLKKYIQILMDWKQKPYRTVSCGFTMVLFQKYHPKTKELTSPKWAFSELEDHSVEEGAERFLIEMREWMPEMQLLWSDDFLDAMDEIEENVYVSDIIFGQRFKVKDFENWSLRLRQAIKKKLLEGDGKGHEAFEL